jgi:transmembrane sensor
VTAFYLRFLSVYSRLLGKNGFNPMNNKRITELTLKAASGVLTPEEQVELDAFLEAFPDNRRRFEERIQKQNVALGLRAWDEAEKTEEESWSRVSRRFTDVNRPAKRRIVFFRRSFAAAAVLLAIAGAWLFWVNRQHTSASQMPVAFTTKNDILPGGNKATLTLSNGKRIVLDDTKTGTLAEEGAMKIIKKDSGQLRYTSLREKPGEKRDLSYNTLTTPKSGTFMVVLPDQTKVWLNSASSLKYPTSFEGQTSREVSLTGEAYFEVAKRPGQPFAVKLNDMKVDVLGTNFDIMAYGDEPAVKTTLLEGAVSVVHRDQRALLKPGEQALLGSAEALKVMKADVNVAVAWKNGFFNFDQADLQAVMRQLARWYGIEVVYNGSVPSRSFFGVIDRQLTLSQALKILESNDIHFSIEGNKLLITP